MDKKNLAILLFDDVEVLDFAGPFEIFSATNELNGYQLLNICTVSLTATQILAKNGLKVVADYTLDNCPKPDYLIIPGGSGTRPLLKNKEIISWVTHTAAECEHLLSVCSGSLLLAVAGLLKGLNATTHHQVFDELAGLAPDARIFRNQRYVDNGKILTSAGVTAGIDMSLYMVAKLFGEEMATQTARYIEYDYSHGAIG